jgi:hypothetical protein
MTKVTMPLGEFAGKELELSKALELLASEILTRQSELQSRAIADHGHVDDLQQYGLAIWLLWYQTAADPGESMSGDFSGLVQIANQLGLQLPPGLIKTPE